MSDGFASGISAYYEARKELNKRMKENDVKYDPKESKLVWRHNPAEAPIGRLVAEWETEDGGIGFKIQTTRDDLTESEKAMLIGEALHKANPHIWKWLENAPEGMMVDINSKYPKYKEEKMNKSGKINITDERDGLVEFGDLITPSVFCLVGDPEPCMKMEDTIIDSAYGYEVTINAVSLISGVTYNFQEDSLVIPLDCDIKIKEKKI